MPFPAQPAIVSSITLTVGVDTYLTLADADAYFTRRFGSETWTAATSDDRSRALIVATRTLDALLLKGRKYVTTQALAFPRVLPRTRSFDDTITQTIIVTPVVVPATVIAAQCEEALAVLAGIVAPPQGVTAQSFGKASETYSGALVTLLSREAQVLMTPWIAGAVRIRGL